MRVINTGNLSDYIRILKLKTVNINTIPLDEQELVKLCKEENALAQEALYERYANRMFRVCYRYLPNEDEAEDAMIKGFVKIYGNVGKFDYRGKGSFEGWMKRIVVNECLMELRRKKMNTTSLDQLAETEVAADVISHLQAEDLYKIIQKLPNGYRTGFSMHVIDGYPHKEIAEILNVSENTSKSQLSKAKALLRKLITENE